MHSLIAITELICEDRYCALCLQSYSLRERSHRGHHKGPALRLFVPHRYATLMEAVVVYPAQIRDLT